MRTTIICIITQHVSHTQDCTHHYDYLSYYDMLRGALFSISLYTMQYQLDNMQRTFKYFEATIMPDRQCYSETSEEESTSSTYCWYVHDVGRYVNSVHNFIGNTCYLGPAG